MNLIKFNNQNDSSCLMFLFYRFLKLSHNHFYLFEIPNQEDVQMASGQRWSGHSRGSNNEIDINEQRRIVIMWPANSILTNMRSMRIIEGTDTTLIDENIDANFNKNWTNIYLRLLRLQHLNQTRIHLPINKVETNNNRFGSFELFFVGFFILIKKLKNRYLYIVVNTDKKTRIFHFNWFPHDNGVTSIG